MPPKRKNKASKTAASTPIKPSPAELAHSKRRNSVQGGKTSRLPSIALHMTTRQAAKTASNHTSSGAPSLASIDSRRSSLNSLSRFEDGQSEENADERPAKRARLSTGSPQPSATSTLDQSAVVNGAQTPELAELPKPQLQLQLQSLSQSSPPPQPPPLPISNGAKTSRKRRASDGSSQSSKTVSARPNGVLTRTESTISDTQPRRKKRKATQTPADSADIIPELTDDASTAPNSPEQLAEVDSSQNLHHVLPTNGEAPAKLGRRLPGRRRAPHPDVNVETDLRRQLNLKMSYRSLAKLQKSLLEELSSRATTSLEKEPDYYKQVPAYEPLMAALDQHKAARLAQVETLRREQLEQLERVRVATEHIEREKFTQRFQDLQEDLLLQCFYRMKQIDRRAKGQDTMATDDEDNIVIATCTSAEFPTIADDDRLGSKYASRSRAYVDTELSLDEDILRRRLGNLQTAFVAKNDDVDDPIEKYPAGFGAYNGPDRTEAMAHWNIGSLLAAAVDVESAPPQPIPPKVIPNEQADALSLLASLAADAPRETLLQMLPEQHKQAVLPSMLTRETSPIHPFPQDGGSMTPMHDTMSDEVPSVPEVSRRSTPAPQINPIEPTREPIIVKTESLARCGIMDIMNDTDLPTERTRESQPPVPDRTTNATPFQQVSASQDLPPLRNGTSELETVRHQQEAHRFLPYSESPTVSSHPPIEQAPWSPVKRFTPGWAPRIPSYTKMSEESLRKRDPLNAIRAMLDAKALSEGRIPASQRNEESARKAAAEREQARDNESSLTGPSSTSGIREASRSSSKDASNPPATTYITSPSVQPLSYHQSPNVAPSYPPPHRSDSQDTTSSHWGRDRRLSGSQAPRDRRLSGSQVPRPPSTSSFVGSPSQHYRPEPSKAGPNQAPQQSSYAAPSAQQLPSISSTLPPKPPGPPPSGPINFCFAYYDPAPSRTSYPSPAPSSYPSTSHPAPYAPAPPQSAPSYGTGPPRYGGYVPPPGSFQAPPPPPTTLPPYPPLKIHQYGGQPILPANMAPPPSHSQQPISFVGQSAPSAYSPPQQQSSVHRRTPSYEHISSTQFESSDGRPTDSMSRQRRQYRSYHAPGTQFRSYQGPDSGRRRGN